MKCPYCGADVTQVQTGNDSTELYVSEDNDAFDCDISVFQCNSNHKHIFYADDLKGNRIEGLPGIQ